MSHDPEIHRLEALLASTDIGEGGYASTSKEAAEILATLAVTLRDPSRREELGGTTLVASVASIVATPVPTKAAPETLEAYLALLVQAARVAANLAADCDVNRARLDEAGYVRSAIGLFRHQPALPVDVLKPLAASVMNLTAGDHTASVEALGSHEDFSALIQLAGSVYSPGEWTGPDHDTRSAIAQWLWTVTETIVPENSLPDYSLSVSDIQNFLPPMKGFAPRDKPADQHGVDESECASTDLAILAHAASVLDRFNAGDKVDHAGLMGDTATMEALFDFVEHAQLPPWVEFYDDDEDEEQRQLAEGMPGTGSPQEKILGIAKAAVARTIVSAIAEADAPEWIWSRVGTWLSLNDRPDLISCALLSYGNKARSDASATALLTPDLVSRLSSLLSPSTPVIVQHALIGLLRNLSIPESNKKVLGDAKVIEKLMTMEPWKENRDVIGSVQGGAVGLVKNLVREPSNAVQFLSSPGPAELHKLIKRTNDGAIAMEGCRVWINCVRPLARMSKRTPDESAAWDYMRSEDVITDLASMLSRCEKYTVLINEAVLALALLAAIGQRGAEIETALLRDPNSHIVTPAPKEQGEVARAPAYVLASVLAPTPERPVTNEVQENTITLVRFLPAGDVKRVILAEIDKTKAVIQEEIKVGVKEEVPASARLDQLDEITRKLN